MSDLQSLLDRVRKAEGPDHGLDIAIDDTLTWPVRQPVPPYTSSLDACLSLMRETLPGAHAWLATEDCSASVTFEREAYDGGVDGRRATTLPLALLDCILQAKIAEAASTRDAANG